MKSGGAISGASTFFAKNSSKNDLLVSHIVPVTACYIEIIRINDKI